MERLEPGEAGFGQGAHLLRRSLAEIGPAAEGPAPAPSASGAIQKHAHVVIRLDREFRRSGKPFGLDLGAEELVTVSREAAALAAGAAAPAESRDLLVERAVEPRKLADEEVLGVVALHVSRRSDAMASISSHV